jgi:hypothetical protein
MFTGCSIFCYPEWFRKVKKIFENFIVRHFVNVTERGLAHHCVCVCVCVCVCACVCVCVCVCVEGVGGR